MRVVNVPLKLRNMSFEMLTSRLKCGFMIVSRKLACDSVLGCSCHAAVGLQCTAASSYGRSREGTSRTSRTAGTMRGRSCLKKCHTIASFWRDSLQQEQIRKHQLELQSLRQDKGDMLSFQLAHLNDRFSHKVCFFN